MRVMQFLTSNKYSGAENVVCQIIEQAKAIKSCEMIYVSPDGDIRDVLEKRCIDHRLLKSNYFVSLLNVIKNFKPDIIQAHDAKASCIAAVMRIIFPSIKIISHLHNNDPLFERISIKVVLYSLASFFFNKIFCVSASVKDEFLFKCVSKKFVAIGNPVNTVKIQAKADYGGINKKEFDIGFIGRFTEQKNPIFFVNIVKQIVLKKGLKIKACMIGDGELFESVQREIKNANLQSYIYLYGFIDNPLPFLKKNRLLCVPSKWEGYGLVCIESMALGIPVICSGVGGMKDLVNADCGCICSSQDEYVDNIYKLLTTPQYLEEKQKNALKRSFELNNINNYFEILFNCFKNIISK